MARKKKVEIDPEQYEEYMKMKIEEFNKQFLEEHTYKVYTFDGRTYVTCKTRDYITRECETYLWKLLQLMGLEIIVSNGLNEYGLAIEGDDPERAAFIQKFIDDGYTLKWK